MTLCRRMRLLGNGVFLCLILMLDFRLLKERLNNKTLSQQYLILGTFGFPSVPSISNLSEANPYVVIILVAGAVMFAVCESVDEWRNKQYVKCILRVM